MSFKTKAFIVAAVCAVSTAPAGAAVAQPAGLDNFALGGGIGTDGGEILAEYRLSDQLVLRGQGSFLDMSKGFNSSDVHYHGKLKSNLGGAFLDWHPGGSAFFLSGGVDAGQRRVDVSANPSASASISINGTTYTATQIGSVYGRVKFADVSPVASLGWDTTFHSASPWGVRVQAGVLFGGEPKVNLTATGPFANDPTVQSNLRAEEASLRNDARDFRYYPLVSAAVTYRF